MTVEADLYNVLKVVCPRAFPDFAPVSTQRPYVTFQQIGGDVVNFVDNQVASKRNAVFQINVWSDRRTESVALARQVEEALIAATAFSARPVAALAADYDADVPVYGTRQDFSVWY